MIFLVLEKYKNCKNEVAFFWNIKLTSVFCHFLFLSIHFVLMIFWLYWYEWNSNCDIDVFGKRKLVLINNRKSCQSISNMLNIYLDLKRILSSFKKSSKMNNESWDEDDDASRYFFEEIIDKSVGVADDEESFATTSNLQMFLNESFA